MLYSVSITYKTNMCNKSLIVLCFVINLHRWIIKKKNLKNTIVKSLDPSLHSESETNFILLRWRFN